MNWKDLAGTLSSFAPIIGTAIGGPAGGIVGAMISKALGVDNTPEEIAKELKGNPEAYLKLKQLESDERIKLKALALQATGLVLEERKAALKDTQNARKQHQDHWMPSLLTIGLALMVAGMFGALFVIEPPKEYDQVVIMIAGSVLGAFGTSVAFWLGSSKGSADKTKQLKGG